MESGQNETAPSEYGVAMRSIKAGKNVFWWLIGICLLLQVTAFVLVEFTDVLGCYGSPTSQPTTMAAKALAATTKTVAATQPTSQPASAPVANVTAPGEECRTCLMPNFYLAEGFNWLSPAAIVIALLANLLLVLTLMFAVQVTLVARLGGAASLVSAFFWSLILLIIITPWQELLPGMPVCGALYDLGTLTSYKSARMADLEVANVAYYYARFLGMPILALAVWLLVQAKFAAGFKKMNIASNK